MTIKEIEQVCVSITEEDASARIEEIHQAFKAILTEKTVTPREIVKAIDQGIGMAKLTPVLEGKLIGAQMLMLISEKEILREKTLRFLQIASSISPTRHPFAEAAMDVMLYPIRSLGFTWKSLRESISLDVLIVQFLKSTVYLSESPFRFEYEYFGKMLSFDGICRIGVSVVGDGAVKALDLIPGKLEAVTRNVRDEKLKASEREDAASIWLFSQRFAESLRTHVIRRETKRIISGDIVDIRCISVPDSGPVFTAIGYDNISGVLDDEELVKGLYTSDLYPFFYEGDVIKGAVFQSFDDHFSFSIKYTYVNYAIKRARYNQNRDVIVEAEAIACLPDINRINWLTADGCGIISSSIDNVEIGDVRALSVLNVKTTGAGVFINAGLPPFDRTPDLKFVDEAILEDFVTTEEMTETGMPNLDDEHEANRNLVILLAMIMDNCSFLDGVTDSLYVLREKLAAMFLYELSGERTSAQDASKKACFISQLIAFAQTGKTLTQNKVQLEPDEEEILFCLRQAMVPDGYRQLLRYLEAPDTLMGQISSLLSANAVSCRFPDEVCADIDIIRKRICTLLHVEDRFRKQRVSTNGKYGSVENHNVEYKSSYVMRNDGQGPDLDYQGKGQVFEAVCGFLNADGGTLYLGVNDSGDPILSEEYGLKADIRWLTENYKLVNGKRFRQLGRSVPKADTVDHFVLFLNAEKSLFFKDSLQGLITIESTEDGDAVRIRVKPSEYEIAYLYSDLKRTDGVAYVRDGGRTIPMSRRQKELRMLSLKKVSKEISFLIVIEEAIEQRRKLIFRNYASGNSGKHDRLVVPVNLFYNDENVYAYDLDARDYKQFRLARIGSIDEVTDSPYYPLAETVPRKADVFRWISDERYHIKLRMDVMAMNYLMEEYSDAKNLPSDEFYEESPNKWILDTYLQGLGAVRRFYLGLADKIEILETEDSDALRKEINEYVDKNLTGKR